MSRFFLIIISILFLSSCSGTGKNNLILSQELKSNEKDIITQLNNSQGRSIDIGGYYHPDEIMLSKAMRPSALFNDAINSLGS